MAETKVSHYLFLVGVALAILAGLVPALQETAWVTWVLVILGLIVGFLNVTAKESTPFLIAGIALIVLAGGIGGITTLGKIIAAIFGNIIAFVAPAMLVVALKAVYALANE